MAGELFKIMTGIVMTHVLYGARRLPSPIIGGRVQALDAPKASPGDSVARLNREINAGLADGRIRQRQRR